MLSYAHNVRRFKLLTQVFAFLAVLVFASAAWSYQIVRSNAPDRAGATPLSGQTVSGDVYVFIDQNSGLNQVLFSLDGALVQTENNAPWDFRGTTPADLSNPFNTRALSNETHTITASLRLSNNTSQTLTASFQVNNSNGGLNEGGNAPQFHTTWTQDPAHSLTVSWSLPIVPATPRITYRPLGTSNWITAPAVLRATTTEGGLLEATITGLAASTTYELKVALGASILSRVYTARTAPPSGTPQNFDALFVADTGLIGRADGLATGTAQVIQELAAYNATVVLLGGDYAYFNTDKRYGTLERTIAAWFEQMLPVVQKTPVMPTYGNHEVLLGEGFDVWADHFPTPEGWNNRRMYSFDIADAHFVSVFGVEESQSIPASGLAWLNADLADAKARGQRWLIPFFHAAPFSEGTNHPSALNLRAQLGPLFETHGVQLVLTSHDQSFERTFPLIDVPATNTATSTSTTCYDLSDGVTWLKVSPGGKLSNISLGFSPWRTAQPPRWTAVRDNTRHHFTHLSVRATGELIVDTYGLTGNGSAPVLQDRFRYTVAGCGANLNVSPATVTFVLEPSGQQSQPLNLSAAGGSLSFTVGTTPAWLSVTPTTGATPATLTATANGALLNPGTTTTKIPVQVNQGELYQIPVEALVGGSEYSLQVSAASDRSAPRALSGATLQNQQYIFLTPETGITQVRFYLDDLSGTGSVFQTENSAPYDFAGTATNRLALPFGTTTRADGAHTISARVTTTDGRSLFTSASFSIANNAPRLAVSPQDVAFTLTNPTTMGEKTLLMEMTDGSTVAFATTSDASWLTVSPAAGTTPETLTLTVNASGLAAGNYQGRIHVTAGTNLSAQVTVNLAVNLASPYQLQLSQSASREPFVPLSGRTVSGQAYVFVPALSNIQSVNFYLDDPGRARPPIKVEANAPWDFAGTASTQGRPALPFNFSTLSGSHQITAAIQTSTGLVVVSAYFIATGG